MDIPLLAIIIIGGVFAIGFLIIALIMVLDKTPARKIQRPPKMANSKKL